MIDHHSPVGVGDPLSAPFWEAACRRELWIQRCRACGAFQFYARPFCLNCQSDAVEWVQSAGRGTVYSMTTVWMSITPELTPPYIVAVVELDEGPRLVTGLTGPCRIGDRVYVGWRDRDGLPPLPVFTREMA